MWGAIAAGIMAALSANKERQKSDSIYEHNIGQAALTKYSPWTGMKGSLQKDNTDALGGAVKGGLMGYSMGSSIDGSLAKSAASESANAGISSSLAGAGAATMLPTGGGQVAPTGSFDYGKPLQRLKQQDGFGSVQEQDSWLKQMVNSFSEEEKKKEEKTPMNWQNYMGGQYKFK